MIDIQTNTEVQAVIDESEPLECFEPEDFVELRDIPLRRD
jgi:hypothetical protein